MTTHRQKTLIGGAEPSLGDWYGLRPNLEDRGFTPTLTFVSDVAGNVTGGKNQGVSEADNLALNLLFDLEKPNRLQLLNK